MVSLVKCADAHNGYQDNPDPVASSDHFCYSHDDSYRHMADLLGDNGYNSFYSHIVPSFVGVWPAWESGGST